MTNGSGFEIERTEGLALLAQYNSQGLGLKKVVGHHLPQPGSNRGYDPVAYVESLVLMLQAGGYFRADSGSDSSERINELEADRVRFAITADQDKAVPEEAWKEPERGCGYDLAEAVHSTEKSEKAFRLILKREICPQPDLFNGEKYVYHVVAPGAEECR